MASLAHCSIVEVKDPESQRSYDERALFHAIEFKSSHGSDVMKLLAKMTFSLKDTGFAHLKRMKKHPEDPTRLQALVVLADTQIQSNVIEALTSLSIEVNPIEVHVPKYAPLTKDEFHDGNRIWPMVFHPHVDLVATTALTEDEIAQMKTHMTTILDVAKALPVHACCRSHSVIIVNPLMNSVVGTSTDYFSPASHHHSSPYNNPLMDHAVMQALSVVAAAQNATRSHPESTHTESYLCTGFDVYLAYEPCVMCAMALVHSRVRRVIYGLSNAEAGALGTLYHLHTKRSLNHRYRVFKLEGVRAN
jgi:tRNA-specific adenosine deaminase 3